MKKQNVILHIINNSYDSVLVEFADDGYSKNYPYWEVFKAFQESHFFNQINVVDENRYESFEDCVLWESEYAFDAYHPKAR